MARRKRFSKPVLTILALALLVGAIAVVYKLLAHAKHDDVTLAMNGQPIVSGAAGTPASLGVVAKPADAKPADARPAVTKAPTRPIEAHQPLIRTETPGAAKPIETETPMLRRPATRPADPPASAPAKTADKPADKSPVDTSLSTSALFAEADAKKKADDLIAARKVILAAMDAHKLSGAEQEEAIRRLGELNETIVFSSRKFLSDEFAVQHTVKPGDNLQKIANQYDVTFKFIQRINGNVDERKLQAGKSLKIVKGPFHALVNKKTFTLDIYIGKPTEPGAVFLRRFKVGLGASDSTPTGTWNVGTKQVNPGYTNPRNEGPHTFAPDDPKNPLGERWIALEGASGQAVGKTSYGIHGTIEPDSIGQMKSMGCIRMLNEDVELVYDLLITGKSTVTVVE